MVVTGDLAGNKRIILYSFKAKDNNLIIETYVLFMVLVQLELHFYVILFSL